MKRALCAFLCALWAIASAGCATTRSERPREMLDMAVPLPACVLICFVRVSVSDDDGSGQDTSQQQPKEPTP